MSDKTPTGMNKTGGEKEIRFRAWDNQIKEMFGVEEISFERNIVYVRSKERNHERTARLIREDVCVLMQFTGLKDKNGKEIYEGDILKITRTNWQCPGHPQHNTDLVDQVEVYWDDERNAMSTRTFDFERLKVNPNQAPYCSSGFLGKGWNDERADENIWEVIGNKFENPELLEAKHER